MSEQRPLPTQFDEDVDNILAQSIAQYERDADKTLQPAHVERLIINSWTYRELLFAKQGNEAYRQGFPQFATGVALEKHGEQVGAIRLPAKPALTTLRFSVDRNSESRVINVDQGAQVSAGDLLFVTSEAASIATHQTFVDVPAECTTTGVAGNGVAVGNASTIEQANIAPVVALSVGNTTVSNSGTDIESDESYRKRILAAPEAFTTGTRGAYAFHAASVSPLIVDVNVDNPRDTQGDLIGGKVDITILTKDGLPSADLITQAQAYCENEKRRDLCDTVTVKAPVVSVYSVLAELVLFNWADKAQTLAAAHESLDTYTQQLAETLGRDVVPLNISSALKVHGVYDVRLAQPALIVVPANGWAQRQSVTLTAATEVVDG